MVATQLCLCSHLFGEDFPIWLIFFLDGVETTNQKKWILQNKNKPRKPQVGERSWKKSHGFYPFRELVGQKRVQFLPFFRSQKMFGFLVGGESMEIMRFEWKMLPDKKKCVNKVCRNLCWINKRLWLTRTTTAFQQKGDFEKLHAFFPQKQWCFRIQMF